MFEKNHFVINVLIIALLILAMSILLFMRQKAFQVNENNQPQIKTMNIDEAAANENTNKESDDLKMKNDADFYRDIEDSRTKIMQQSKTIQETTP